MKVFNAVRVQYSARKKVLTVIHIVTGGWLFKTIDDCFGMDRVREFCEKNHFELIKDKHA